MFTCDRCGSRYSAMHAATMENCPRCQVRDRVSAPLAFKAFQLPDSDLSHLEGAEREPSAPDESQVQIQA